MLGYFFARNEKVFKLNLVGPNDDPRDEEGEFKFDRFKKMAEAAARALEPYNVTQRDVVQSTPRRLLYRGMQQIPRPAPNVTMQPDISDGTGTLMFGYEDGAAVLDRFIEQDRDLTDGVIPYDPQPAADPSPSATSFTLASCQYPAGFIDEPVAYCSYHRIIERLLGSVGIKPRFSVFVGDQVYVDPTAGLYDPAAKADQYRLPYEAWLRQRSVRGVLRRIPSFMLLDDHEIDDNWEPIASPDEKINADKKRDGVKAYQKYQRGRSGGLETFDFDGFHFFMLDTRTERTHRKVDGSLANATLFDWNPTNPADVSKTMGRLQKWLLEKPKPKFVLSPSMLLPRHRRAVQRDVRLDPLNLSALHSDGWDGYPNTLREFLAFIAHEKIEGVVFLSGDEHRGCVATVELLDATNTLITRIHSLHTAAAYSPFPFANSLDEDIVENETIDLASSYGSYRCKVSATRPAPGDGATFLSVRKDGAAWKLDYEFADGVVKTLVL